MERQLKFKKECVDYKGGKCTICGYNKSLYALDFHHRNPDEKEFALSHITPYFNENIKGELDKCDLLCANCHRETHEKITIEKLKG